MIIVTGWGSAIVQALLPMLPADEQPKRSDVREVTTDGDRYLFCAGVIRSKPIVEQSDHEILETFIVNAASVMQACDRIVAGNDRARICIVGSESGFAGSFDGAYAASKAAVHAYVESKRLRTPGQQLVCIAPSIIGDAGMTTRRADKRELAQREMLHPKGRFLAAEEVARLVRHLLYVDRGYLSGIVIRMNGGEHTQ